MILVDDRTGSRELLPIISRSGTTAKLTRLAFGDAAFIGNGPASAPVFVGIERKTLRDLINSITSGRLSGYQVPGMTCCYRYSYLIVEGIWKTSPYSGLIEIYRGGKWKPLSSGPGAIMAREVWNYLNTLSIMADIRFFTTRSPAETVSVIKSLYGWWNDKKFDQHYAHLTMKRGERTGTILRRPSLLCRVAAELPGIGHLRAKNAEQEFESIMDMAVAGEDRWIRVKNVGGTTAYKVVQALRERNTRR